MFRVGYLLVLFALLPLRPCAAATSLSEYMLFQNWNETPEGDPLSFGSNEDWYGRIHVNGRANFEYNGHSLLGGVFTQEADSVTSVPPEQYDSLFPGGWAFPYARAVWPPEDGFASIRAASSPEHRWPAEEGGEALTTLLRFDHAEYHVAQYFPARSMPGDTAFHVPWTTLELPRPPESMPLIWIEGVGRLKGVVEGELTVLVSDSLFLMGDLIVSDAVLSPCNSEPNFGSVPAGSPNRIGLIGEKDVIIAATLENGFANGEPTPALGCGLLNDDPVVSSCQQNRKDIVITAAILAGCSFESEFWNTTARGATVPDSSQNAVCEGWNNTHVRVWSAEDCPGSLPLSDRRGRIWLTGSLALGTRGYVIRNSGPWGDAWIGYASKVYRQDVRLVKALPPYWPDPDWIWNGEPVPPPDCSIIADEINGCGVVDDSIFVAAASARDVGLRLAWTSVPRLPVRFRVRSAVRTVLDTLVVGVGPSWDWRPFALEPDSPDPDRLFEFEEPFWIEARGDWFEWNMGGSECSWVFDQYDEIDEPPAHPTTPALGFPFPNPFNPATRVSVTLARPETVRLALVDLLGREARVVREGPLPAGEHALVVDGAGLPSGLYLLRLQHGDGTMEVRKALLLR